MDLIRKIIKLLYLTLEQVSSKRIIFIIFLFYPYTIFAQKKTTIYKYFFSATLGSSNFQNDLNDSKNLSFNNSIYYLDSTTSNIANQDKLLQYNNKSELENENSAEKKSSILNVKYNFDYFLFKSFTLGFRLGTSRIKFNEYQGGYSLLLNLFTNEPVFIPSTRNTSLRGFDQRLLSLGYYKNFDDFDVLTRFYFGSGRIWEGEKREFRVYTDAPAIGFSIGFAFPFKIYDGVLEEKRYHFLTVELTTLKYYIPGNYGNVFFNRLETAGYLNIIEYNLTIGYRFGLGIEK